LKFLRALGSCRTIGNIRNETFSEDLKVPYILSKVLDYEMIWFYFVWRIGESKIGMKFISIHHKTKDGG